MSRKTVKLVAIFTLVAILVTSFSIVGISLFR